MAKHTQKIYTLRDILGAELTHEEALARIESDPEALEIFQSFDETHQEMILSFIQGNQGLRILRDRFSQRVLDPYTHPKRMESLLSSILGQKVRIVHILTREGNRMVDSGSLVIMDFCVELKDGSFIDIEIQQVGYAFPGERSCCYEADLIMRQYNLLHSKFKKDFTYRQMKPVIVIIFMQNSSEAFLKVAPHYIHHEIHSFDTGAQVTNLSNTIYISLDTFHNVVQNISTKLDAWLTFLSSDAPSDIVKLVNAYPEFLSCYKDIVEFRRNPKELMNMYSEALAFLDKNTERYMVDELRKKVEERDAALADKDAEIAKLKLQLAQSSKD